MAEGLIALLTGVGSFNCYFCTRPFFLIIIYVEGRYGYNIFTMYSNQVV